MGRTSKAGFFHAKKESFPRQKNAHRMYGVLRITSNSDLTFSAASVDAPCVFTNSAWRLRKTDSDVMAALHSMDSTNDFTEHLLRAGSEGWSYLGFDKEKPIVKT